MDGGGNVARQRDLLLPYPGAGIGTDESSASVKLLDFPLDPLGLFLTEKCSYSLTMSTEQGGSKIELFITIDNIHRKI